MNYWGYLIGYGYLAVLIGIAELLSRRTNLSREVLRKVLHCLIGLEWFVLYYFFPHTWQIVVIPASFILVNALSYRFRFFRSIERDEGNHYGTIYYAMAMTAMSIATAVDSRFMLPFGIAVVSLSFGDAAAALAGQHLKPRIEVFGKTLWGVVACLVFSFAACIALFAILQQPIRWTYLLAIAVVSALTEVLSQKGTDNVFVCLWCFLWGFALFVDAAAIQIVLICYIGFILAAVCYNTRSFTPAASMVAGVMLAAVGLLGGWFAFLFILLSYGVVYFAEHLVKKEQYKETRTVRQIAQNGLWAMALIIAYYCTDKIFLLLAFVVSITESLVDSIAGVMGNAYGTKTFDVLTHKPIAKGLSGGISLEGTLCALFVSAIPGIACGFIFGWQWYLVAICLLPFGGMLLDSVLGASIQYKQQCIVCGAVCECTAHCSRPTVRFAGHPFFTNGRINLITNFITTGVALLVLYFVFPL